MRQASDVEAELAGHRERLLRWLLDDALPLWWSVGADRAGGGFHEAIDLAGHPVRAARRARVQARQIFAYAVGGELGWTGPWREAVAHGLDYFIGRYRRPDGFFWNAIDVEGEPAPSAPHLYEQAFALLALATASGKAAVPMAEAIVARLYAERRGAAGGFTGFADEEVYQSDPHMHLLEAALAWEGIAPDGPWRRLADEVVELCLARFVSPRHGALLEYFDSTWAPAKGAMGDAIWPGHQFEGAGLLERWALAREGRDDVRAVARRLYDIGMRHGIDAARGVAVFELSGEFSVREPTTRLWVQTEWLKAAMILARSESEPGRRRRYLGDAVAAARALELFLDLPVRGLWRDKLQGDGTWVDEPAPASSFYHIIDAIRVLAQSPAIDGSR